MKDECDTLKKFKEDLLDETDSLNDMLGKMREELETEKVTPVPRLINANTMFSITTRGSLQSEMSW